MPRRELIDRNFSIDACLDVLFFSAPLNAQATPVLASPENSIIPGHQLSLTGFQESSRSRHHSCAYPRQLYPITLRPITVTASLAMLVDRKEACNRKSLLLMSCIKCIHVDKPLRSACTQISFLLTINR